MNFFDTYDLGSASTTPTNQPQQSLNEEVSDVMGQIGRFWGSFRKQSQTALEIARRDIGGVVNQAQRELSRLSTSDTSDAQSQGEHSPDDSEATSTTPTNHEASSSSTPALESSENTQTLFSRLQSALPPNIVSTVRDHLPDSLKQASGNIDIGQMRTNLLSELQRVQGITRAQAEEYVHKSEALLKEAVREAGEVLKDAVKVVPPEEVEEGSRSQEGAIWDGTDMWMLPASVSDTNLVDGTAKGKASEGGTRQQVKETHQAVSTRAEALLRRLKHDPDIVRYELESDANMKEHFSKWLEERVNTQEGGIEGTEWMKKRGALLEDAADGPRLQKTYETVVPSEMNEVTFWQRFFFRAHQIAQEEEKRKALIEATTANEEDFNWEDDDEEPASAHLNEPSQGAPAARTAQQGLTGTRSSSREGSEASYDVVSSGQTSTLDAKESKVEEEEEEDSDWE
ncbi:hypothetical protein AMATHDRAFT_75281 [Amanita thiersii Skay4041]|uniref:BSD domain-containing protein n=1 Tax=Amanita thiersii Skay4041 TaxID=703135 RepID=A0A2A9NRK1_9AGAR|nr:hypothetical protein AMATHDRAFT_75281 [Amanita thiersii Skay4041]